MATIENVFELLNQHIEDDERLLEIKKEIGYQMEQLRETNKDQQTREIAFTLITLCYLGACFLIFK